MKRVNSVLLAVGVALLAAVAQAGILISEKEVRRQFRVDWLQKKRHIPLESDPRVVRFVDCVAKHIIAQVPPEYAELDWEVVVFDDEDQINAFADPNGKIGVFTGILKAADSQDALAAVLGHEVAHVTEGHVMARARSGARQDLWVTLGGAATGMPDMVRQGVAIYGGFPFIREQETESDLVGQRYMAEAGFDPRAGVYLWKNMAAAKEEQPRVPEWLSTHPSDSTRTDNMIKSLTPNLIQYNAAREAGRRPNCQSVR